MYLNNSVNKIYSSNVAPNPIEVVYWADLSEAADGSVIKTFNGKEWVAIGSGSSSCSCTFTNGTDGSFTVTKGDCEGEEGTTEQKVTIGKPATAGTADTLSGLTATVAELNYCDGVTSAIQTQLNGKAASSHTHTIANITNLQTTLDGKASTAVATTSTNGLMSSVDKTKLDGMVSVPTGGTEGQVLKKTADGVAWQADNNTTYPVATTSANGLMSSSDKTKLDGIAANANNYTLPNASTSTRGGVLQGVAVADAVEDGTETATTVTATLNALLASLRTAGVIAA